MSKIVVLNMKMLLEKREIEKYNEFLTSLNSDNLIVCPSTVHISLMNTKKYNVGIQNVYYEEDGAYTGEISCEQAFDMGVKYAIVGHSERRINFNENDEIISKKINACLKYNIKPILCVGENKDDDAFEVIRRQVLNALFNVTDVDVENIIIAYEPVYLIGTGIHLEFEKIKEYCNYIKEIILEKYNKNIKVIYGGSVNSSNVRDIANCCDGVMIGSLCENVVEVKRLIDEINK